MPAQQTYNKEDGLEIRVIDDDLERRRSVYFTNQSPSFNIRIKNTSDKRIEGDTYTRLSFERSPDDFEDGTHHRIEFDLNPGEKQDFEHKLDMLSYQGGAALTVDEVHARDRDDHIEVNTRAGTRLFRLYTFMIYDREYYKLNYLRPRRAQYISAILAVLIILVGVIQIWASSKVAP